MPNRSPRHRPIRILALGASIAALAACGGADAYSDLESSEGEPAQDEELGTSSQAALNPNALNPNALNPNALNPNALNPNALNPNALNPNAMSPSASTAMQDPGAAGDLSRQFLKYAVSCAFSQGMSFNFSWKDSSGVVHPESYPGLLGLAPAWATGPLDSNGQHWVSACLGSRVNAKGVSVQLSSRGSHAALATSSGERSQYNNREGAFFGNLFSSTPTIYACYDSTNVTASTFDSRMCANVTTNLLSSYQCGSVKVMGACSSLLGLLGQVCPTTSSNGDRYYADCKNSSGTKVPQGITTFLDSLL